jgi:hypothetical protein
MIGITNLWQRSKSYVFFLGRQLRTPRGKEVAYIMLGAVLLLGTFYVHEVKREQAKDLSDALDRAQGVIILRTEIQALEQNLPMNPAKVPKNPHPFSDDIGLSVGLERCLADVEFITANFDNARKEQFKRRISSVRASLKAMDVFKQSLIELAGAMENAKNLQVDVTETQKKYVQSQKDFTELGKNAINLVLDLYTDTLSEASYVADQSRKEYELATRISYVLIPLGLILGLIGKLTGLGEINPAG